MRYTLDFSTRLTAPKPEAWEWITSFDGISREMAPYLHMSAPKGVTSIKSVSFEPGQRMFRSWIKLFGVVPIDYSDLTLMSLDEGNGFVEQSPMGSMRLWRHERRLASGEDGCVLTDQLTFEPRVAGWLTFRIIRAFFSHRHRNLARYLGRPPTPEGRK